MKKAKNWKTTLFGIVALAGSIMASGVLGEKPTKVGTVIVGIGAAGGFSQAKDKDVTGGTREQSSEPQVSGE